MLLSLLIKLTSINYESNNVKKVYNTNVVFVLFYYCGLCILAKALATSE